MGKGLFKSLGYYFQLILNIIYPSEYKCLYCGKETDTGICNSCNKNIRLVQDVIQEKYLGIYCYAYYKGVVKSLILDFKYSKDYTCGEYMASLLIDRFTEIIADSQLITYVPLTNRKKKDRGFNQCELLAKNISREFDIDTKELLYKVKENKEQKRLDAKTRGENVKDVYKINEKYNIKDKKIILIDDVFTTGATIRECAKVLYENGAKSISAITFAKSTI